MEKNGKSGHLGGFTLIEMLVVIVIIVILMGVVFRLSRAALAKGNDAKETARVAIFKTLIEEFHAEYGIYPPVPEYGGKQPISFKGPFPEDGQDLNYYVNHYAGSEIFQFGLLSFFVNRPDYGERTFKPEVGGRNHPKVKASWEGYNDEVGSDGQISQSSKDKAFVKRVKPILDQFEKQDAEGTGFAPGTTYDENGHTTGFCTYVNDSWGHEYVYISEPPYTSYLIFSKGADGQYDASAPADKTLPKNRDNIYAGMEDN